MKENIIACVVLLPLLSFLFFILGRKSKNGMHANFNLLFSQRVSVLDLTAVVIVAVGLFIYVLIIEGWNL